MLVAAAHPVNITALTGLTPGGGAGVIAGMSDAMPTVLGILPPPVVADP